MSFKDFINQPASGACLWLVRALVVRTGALANRKCTIKIWRPRAFGAEYVQIFKALRLNHLHKAEERM